MDDIKGKILADRYEIDKQLGKGGTAHVYKVFDLGADRSVRVVKEIDKSNRDLYEMAKEEASRMKSLFESDNSSRYFPNIHHLFETDSHYYIVMDFIDGESMETMIGEEPMPNRIFLDAAKQICSCIKFLHDQNLVYSDMKPDNMMVLRQNNDLLSEGSEITLKFIDFGTTVLDSTDVTGYTPEYAAPEQFRQEKIDKRTDIFNIGATFYHMIQGRKPLKVNKGRRVCSYRERFVFSGKVDSSIKHIILKCVEENPDKRYQSCDELFKALCRAEKKTSLHIFMITLALTVLCFAGYGILSLAATNAINNATDRDYAENVRLANYEEAIKLRPENRNEIYSSIFPKDDDGIYLKLIDSYKLDDRLDANESAFINDYIRARHPISSNDKEYARCMFEIGNVYFLYYDPYDWKDKKATDNELFTERINNSYYWLDTALKNSSPEDDHYRRTKIFCGICEFYSNINKLETEGRNKPEMYTDMWNDIEELSEYIDSDNEVESARVCQTLRHLISRYCDKFSKNNITRQQQLAVIDKIEKKAGYGDDIRYNNETARKIAGSFDYDAVRNKITGLYEDKKGGSDGSADIG